jgi:galactokinase
MNTAQVTQKFEQEFGTMPKVFAAPGRVNLIGEHTDYNDGFVLPCAIGFTTQVAIAPRPDRKLILVSEGFSERFEFDLADMPRTRLGAWCDYVLGVAVLLRQMEALSSGASVLIHGGVPVGAGLSSSAAVEVASALAFMSLNGAIFPMPQVAQMCQRAENTFVGAQVGIMDQFISCLGKAGHALRLDCRSLEFEQVPIPADVRLVICNTMVKHEHAGGEYNRRREECDEGVRILTKWYPGIRALRDVSPARLEAHAADLPATIYQRCSHVVHENQRVLDGSRALAAGDLPQFGELMHASHISLRDLYAVSCEERAHDGRWFWGVHRQLGERAAGASLCRRNRPSIQGENRNYSRHLCLLGRERGLRRTKRKLKPADARLRHPRISLSLPILSFECLPKRFPYCPHYAMRSRISPATGVRTQAGPPGASFRICNRPDSVLGEGNR